MVGEGGECRYCKGTGLAPQEDLDEPDGRRRWGVTRCGFCKDGREASGDHDEFPRCVHGWLSSCPQGCEDAYEPDPGEVREVDDESTVV